MYSTCETKLFNLIRLTHKNKCKCIEKNILYSKIKLKNKESCNICNITYNIDSIIYKCNMCNWYICKYCYL